MNIYLYTNGATKGPYPFSQIEAMRQHGKLVADALYCIEGTEEWRSVSELPAAKQGVFLTCFVPVIFLGLLAIAYWLLTVVIHQKQAQQAEQAQQTTPVYKPRPFGADNLQQAANSGIEAEKRILTLRQAAHDSMCHVFTEQLPTKMQAFLDMGYYLTISQPRGAELGSKSGLVATRAVLESLAVDWLEGARPTTLNETFYGIQTYTVVYTIYWQPAGGGATGFYKFEHRFNLQTRETISVRLLQTGDLGN